MTLPAPIKLAIYDLDRTITRVPTWSLFLLDAARRRAPWRLALVPLLAPALALKAAGVIDRDRLKQIMHRLLLGHSTDAATLDAQSVGFARRFVARHVLEGARRQMAADRQEGRRIVIATAAHRFYAAPIATLLGVDDLVATEARRDARGHVLSTLDGPNCYGPAKLAMIRTWLDRAGIARAQAHIRFYSDHRSDAPTLDWADEAMAVNAHRPLQRLARQQGWRTADWRG